MEKWKNGLIMMGDLPKWKECEVQSRCNGWPTQNGKNMKCGLIVMGDLPRWKKYDEVRSHCHGWPTQMEKMWKKTGLLWLATYLDGKNVIWQVWKIGLTWRSPEGMTEEGLENLVLPDNSRSYGLKTRCFLTARVENSRLPNCKVDLFISLGFS